MLLEYALLTICSLVAVGWSVRIYRWNQTKDQKYKHSYSALVEDHQNRST